MSFRNTIKFILLIALVSVGMYYYAPHPYLVLSSLFPEKYRHIVVFHTNDIHGQIQRNFPNRLIGMSNIATLIKANSNINGNNLLLDVGDTFYGTNESDLNGGMPLVDIMNELNYTAIGVGNHEFDFGVEQLLKLKEVAEFEFLSSNLYKNGKRLFKPYIVKKVDGINIGIIGYISADLLAVTKPEFVKDLTVDTRIEALGKPISELETKADYIILIAHEMLDELQIILEAYPSIDLLLAGHDHAPEYNFYSRDHAEVTINEDMTREIGKLDIVFVDKKPVYINRKFLSTMNKSKQDPKILNIVNNYTKTIHAKMNEVIGHSKFDLIGGNNARFEETSFGNAIADAMKEHVHADLALQNGGGIRTNIFKGDITLYDVYSAFPFLNYVIAVEMSGEQIIEALEHGVKKYPNPFNGRFLQISGLTFTFDASRRPGKRIKSVKIGGRPLQKDRMYKVATNDFMFQGGDRFYLFRDTTLLEDSGILIRDVFSNHLKNRKTLVTNVDNRIRIIND